MSTPVIWMRNGLYDVNCLLNFLILSAKDWMTIWKNDLIEAFPLNISEVFETLEQNPEQSRLVFRQ